MKKLIILISLFFIGCQQEYNPVFKYEKNTQEIVFKIKNEYLGYKLVDPKYVKRTNRYVIDGFTLGVNKTSSNMHVEHVGALHNVIWNGQARSLYENFLKEVLKVKSFRILQRIDVNKNYELTSYLVDNKYRLDLIYIFDFSNNTFILDGTGKVFNLLVNKFNLYDEIKEDYPRYFINVNKSLTELNPLKQYFHIGG